MGAGRKAARGIKAYLGLRDTDAIYEDEQASIGTRFGINTEEHGFARLRIG